MIRLNAASNLPNLSAPRVSVAIQGQGGAFAQALASQQPSGWSNQPAIAPAPAETDDRQDLAVAGSDLPEAGNPSPADLTDRIAPNAAAIDLQRPNWRFASPSNDDSAGTPAGDGDASADDSEDKAASAEDGAAAPTGTATPQLAPAIAQPVPQPAVDTLGGASNDGADRSGTIPATGQAGRGGPQATQPPAEPGAQVDQTAPDGTNSPSAPAKGIAQGAPSLAAIAPFASPAKAPSLAKLTVPSGTQKAEAPAKEAAGPQSVAGATQQANVQQADAQQRVAPHAAAVSLAAEALPIRSGADRRHVADSLDGIAAASFGSSGGIAAHAVQPGADSQQPSLDLNRQDWMAGMIDQIETLRDADGARTARIRLNPDAMGTVDVSVRHDGDAVHVHFASETAATRTLLGDAAPALAQLAEQRGIRLSQSSVDAGAGQAGNQQRQEAQQSQRTTASAPASAQADEAGATDDRIA